MPMNRENRPFFEEVLKAIRSHSLREVKLCFLGLGPEEAKALAEALSQGRQVTSLDLSGNFIGHRGARALAGALKGSAISSLFLDKNGIGVKGATALAAVLKDCHLTELSLSGTPIGEEGLVALAEGLKHSTVTKLDLSNNNFGSYRTEGIRALAAVLRISDLSNLRLTLTDIGEENRAVLLDGLRDSGITQVGGSMRYPMDRDIAAVLLANRSRSFVLQLKVEAAETELKCSFHTLGGSLAAALAWNPDRPLKELPEELLIALRRSGFKGFCAANLRIVRPDGGFLDVSPRAALLDVQMGLSN